MMKTTTLSLLLLLTLTSFAQSTKLNLKKIEAFAQTDAYTGLKQRFQNNDTTLSEEEYRLLYYGQAFKHNSDTMRTYHDKALNQYLEKAGDSIDFEKVLQLSLTCLSSNPLNFDNLYITGVAYDKTSKPELASLYYDKYHKLIYTIMASGDGKKEKSAFVVVSISDEYTILRALNLRFKSQALVSKKKKFYDILYVTENKKGIDKVYFDINLFFGKFF